MTEAFGKVAEESIANPDEHWRKAATAIDWIRPSERIFGDGTWFPEGMLNTCFNCLDRHVAAGYGDSLALIYDSPVTGTARQYTYFELLTETGRVAAMLSSLGVAKGDRVLIYMPMVPEALFSMLACARLGAVHSVVFGGFAALELAKRIDDAAPKIILAASCGIEGQRTIAYKPLVDEALTLARHTVDHVVLLQRDMLQAELSSPRDIDWASLRAQTAADPIPEPVSVLASDPLYLLYTSGTTGTPKGVVRDNGGHAVALAWSMANIYGVGRGDTFWAASDVGWVVGHSYIVYAPLLVGATTVLFEGKPVGTPNPGTFWRLIERYNVKVFFTAPTAIRAIRREDPDAELLKRADLSGCTAIFLAGERADLETIAWLEENSGLPVIDHWWQTELGWPGIASCLALGDNRRKRGSAGLPVPGYSFAILDEAGLPLPPDSHGSVAIRLPLPPGAFQSLWNNPEGYRKCFAAFPGYYETGDAGFIDPDGFVFITERTDDIINVAGHRLSTGQMEQIVAGTPGVVECAVIGADDKLKGTVPMAFVVTSATAKDDPALAGRVIGKVRAELGPVAALKTVAVVPQLPKTRSGKILRSLLRSIVNGEDVSIPSTIDDPTVPDTIRRHIAPAKN